MDLREELLNVKCPIAITQYVVAVKWKLVIIWQLLEGPKRFNEWKKLLPDIDGLAAKCSESQHNVNISIDINLRL